MRGFGDVLVYIIDGFVGDFEGIWREMWVWRGLVCIVDGFVGMWKSLERYVWRGVGRDC